MARPKKHIDMELVEKLAHIHCTQEEIAEVVGVSVKTLQRSAEFCRVYKKGISSGRMSLRRQQWKTAEKGSVAMQIWLGKQYLNQKDDHDLVNIRNEELRLKQLEAEREHTPDDTSSNIDNYITALRGEVAEVFKDVQPNEKPQTEE